MNPTSSAAPSSVAPSAGLAPRRYHPILAGLHWLMAFALIFMLLMAMFGLTAIPNTAPEKVDALRGHMIFGVTMLSLMLLRLIVKLRTEAPARAAGAGWQDWLAALTHGAMYLCVFVMGASGIATSVMAGLPDVVFNAKGSLPADFHEYWPRGVHGITARILLALITLHIVAVIWHQMADDEGVLHRMGFGRRT